MLFYKWSQSLVLFKGRHAELNLRLYLDVPSPQCTAAHAFKFNHLAPLSVFFFSFFLLPKCVPYSSAIFKPGCIRMCKRNSPCRLNIETTAPPLIVIQALLHLLSLTAPKRYLSQPQVHSVFGLIMWICYEREGQTCCRSAWALAMCDLDIQLVLRLNLWLSGK